MAGRKRDRKKESFWRRVVRRQSGSGLGVRAWCVEQGVAEHSFYAWRRKLAWRDAEQADVSARSVAAKPASMFVPVRVAEEWPTKGQGRIEIVLACGQQHRHRVHIEGGVDRQTLTDVLAVLASVSVGEPEASAC